MILSLHCLILFQLSSICRFCHYSYIYIHIPREIWPRSCTLDILYNTQPYRDFFTVDIFFILSYVIVLNGIIWYNLIRVSPAETVLRFWHPFWLSGIPAKKFCNEAKGCLKQYILLVLADMMEKQKNKRKTSNLFCLCSLFFRLFLFLEEEGCV